VSRRGFLGSPQDNIPNALLLLSVLAWAPSILRERR
jgi:hypothetical protein